MRNFRNLLVWQRGHELTLAVYDVSASFPTKEAYSLTSQIRRAAISIPANIAEGSGRGSHADFAASHRSLSDRPVKLSTSSS